jgi:hypothetical protein
VFYEEAEKSHEMIRDRKLMEKSGTENTVGKKWRLHKKIRGLTDKLKFIMQNHNRPITSSKL